MSNDLTVRQLRTNEIDIILDYFHGSTPEHLERLGVDPTRIPSRQKWRSLIEADHALPLEKRASLQLLWLSGETPVGISTADTITFGADAKMHLHVIDPDNRRRGIGVECVRMSVREYFNILKLKRLYCEPNAFNVAPNRTLQKAGFRYVKTHKTVPNWLNYHQAITRWVIEKEDL